MDAHDFGNALISVRVARRGAELTSLRHARAGEMLWDGGAAWPRHAPVLFPIVGRLSGDTLRHKGFTSRLTQHGFARDRDFAWEASSGEACRLTLRDDAETRAIYPFRFALTLAYAVRDATLETSFTIDNTGDEVLPASLGAHPAFRWPLAEGVPKTAHRLHFEQAETGPVRRLEGGTMRPEPQPNPIVGRELRLDESLFADDAVILEQPASRRVRYEAPGRAAPFIDIGWEGFSSLGIWSKPADFVCVEPWSGYASPNGFAGELAEKPGILLIAPGARIERRMTITIGEG